MRSAIGILLALLMSQVCYGQFNQVCVSPNNCSQVVAVNGVPVVMSSAEPNQILKSDTVKFKRSLLQAARQARKTGEISMGQHLAIIVASQRPATLERMKVAAHELAVEDGMATAASVDWDKLIGFLEKLIPLIVQIIGLFG